MKDLYKKIAADIRHKSLFLDRHDGLETSWALSFCPISSAQVHKYTSTQVLIPSSSNREISYIYKNSFRFCNSFGQNGTVKSACHAYAKSTSSCCDGGKRAALPRRCGRKHRSICEILCECCRSPRTNGIAASGIGGN